MEELNSTVSNGLVLLKNVNDIGNLATCIFFFSILKQVLSNLF